ncbi:MAG: hypothetical protein IJU50_04585 [Lachnospiraceae bacterium]|nr:hypothetical protein [Lachnospiraceae bacterium]
MSGSAKSSLPLLVGLLSLLIFILVYMNIFTPARERIKALKEANEALETEIEDLQNKSDAREYYASETERMRKIRKVIYGFFPADVMIEDAIVMALNIEDEAPALVPSVGFVPSADIYTMGDEREQVDLSERVEESQANADDGETTLEEDVEVAQAGGATYYSEGADVHVDAIKLPGGYEGEYGKVTLRDAVTTLNFQTSYDGMKRLVEYFTEKDDRTTIAQISLAYDTSTGLLNGSSTLNQFSLTGTGRSYTPPAFPIDMIGTSNIFGTVRLENGGYDVTMPQDEGMPLEESESPEESDDGGVG